MTPHGFNRKQICGLLVVIFLLLGPVQVSKGKENCNVATAIHSPVQIAVALGMRRSASGRYFCPLCQTGPDHRSPDMALQANGFRCFKCGIHGNLIELVKVVLQVDFPTALAWIRKRGMQPIRVPISQLGRPNKAVVPCWKPISELQADAYVEYRAAIDDEGVLDYLWKQRGINSGTADRCGLGAKDIRRDQDGSVIGCTWVMAMLEPEGLRHVVGFRFHRDQPKSIWSTAGAPTSHVLYPWPEQQFRNPGDRIVLAPGELKALCWISAGYPATARTSGEAADWPNGLAEHFRDLHVLIDADREDSIPARAFESNAVAALQPVARSIRICGKRSNA